MVRMYGIGEENYVVAHDKFNDHVSDLELETVAKRYLTHFGAKEVWAVYQRKDVTEAWRDYVRNCNKRNGTAEYARFEFVDFLRSGDWRIA